MKKITFYWLFLFLAILQGNAQNFEARINFQNNPNLTPPPLGYVADYGKAFGTSQISINTDTYTYGWKLKGDNTPFDASDEVVGNANGIGRNRLGAAYLTATEAEKLTGTLVHLQGNHIPGWTTQPRGNELIWEIEVPNGIYDIVIGAGDTSNSTDSRHSLTVEGITIMPGFIPTARETREESLTIEVTDNVLTVDALGGFNSKINYINITSSTDTPISNSLNFANTNLNTTVAENTSLLVSENLLASSMPTNLSFSIEGILEETTATIITNEWLSIQKDGNVGSNTFEINTDNFTTGAQQTASIIATAKGFTPATLDLTLNVDTPACSPISTLTCDQLKAQLPLELTFDGTQGGIANTGFTMVDNPSARLISDSPIFSNEIPGFEPSKISINSNNLLITATKGIAFQNNTRSSNTNSQINTLGVGIDFNELTNFDIITTIDQPYSDTSNNFEQAGIWLGLNEDNFIKFSTRNNNILDLLPEIDAIAIGDQGIGLTVPNLNTSKVRLRLNVDAVTNTITAFYKLNADNEVLVGSIDLPMAIKNGNPNYSNLTFAGIYASKRNENENTEVTYTFEDFSILPEQDLVDVKINFTTNASTDVATYLKDTGLPFNDQGNDFIYGWLTTDGITPLDLSANTRNRAVNGITELQNTLIHLQYGDVNRNNGNITEGIWELEVPNGVYTVSVSLGDPLVDGVNFTPMHSINIEGTNLIDKFIPTGDAINGNRFTNANLTTNVTDGRLTIDANGGFNTKINSIEVTQISKTLRPFFTDVNPQNNSTDVALENFQIGVGLITPSGYELDENTIDGNINLFEVTPAGEVLIPSNSNDTGGGDFVNLTPLSSLKENTTYVFRITAGVQANLIGNLNDRLSFLPFEATFTTGTQVIQGPSSRDLTGISFEKVSGNNLLGEGTENERFSSLVIGPDGKLYASTIGNFVTDGKIQRWTIEADGSLSNLEVFEPELNGAPHPVNGIRDNDTRLIIGMDFDPASTATDPIIYITHSTAALSDAPEWDGVLTRLSGPNFETVQDVLIHLPRSAKDHLTNSITFDNDSNMYISQGSNSAGGEIDPAWAFRPERLLAAAILKVELNKLPVTLPLSVFTTDNISVINNAPSDTILMSDNTYNPYATNSPVTIFTSGVRNAYDLVWHSNGWMYIPTNGTAGNNTNSPNAPSTADYELARRIDGLTTLPDTPALEGGNTQKDWLFKSQGGSYHGHPNPYRGEFVLNHGGQAYSNLPGQEDSPYIDVPKYPATVLPDPNYQEPAYDFGFNKSPNGVIEYKSTTFEGRLQGLLFVTRFSGQDDLLGLDVNSANGDVIESYNAIPGLQGFDDPLDVVEDVNTGNLYISEYDRTGGGTPRLTLLRASSKPNNLSVSANELLFETTVNTDGNMTQTNTITISNIGLGLLEISAISLSGNFSDQFDITPLVNIQTINPGATLEYAVTYAPDLNEQDLGFQDAILTIESNNPANPTTTINLNALKKAGFEGNDEPSLQSVVNTLGIGINVGWTTLTNTTNPDPIGDEIETELWEKATDAPVTLTPVARYSPAEELPYGWYTNQLNTQQLNFIDTLENSVENAQTLFPPSITGIKAFDPQDNVFGIFVQSLSFGRNSFTQDQLNSGGVAHRTRIYPNKDRNGNLIENSYLITFEDASNGDYQDYVFILDNATPSAITTQSNGILSIENRTKIPTTTIGFPANDYLTFHKVRDVRANTSLHDSNTLRLHNTGTETLMVSDITIAGPPVFSFEITNELGDVINLPITIDPNSFVDLPITFDGDGSDGKSFFINELTILSNAVSTPEVKATLNGSHQQGQEGTREINAQQVFDAFGFKTSMLSIVNDNGTITPPNRRSFRPSSNFPNSENIDLGYEGDMVLSDAFVQADPTQPVIGFQISAMHGRGSNGAQFIGTDNTDIVGGINFSHANTWFQTLLPRNNRGSISFDTAAIINEPFRIAVANYLITGGNNIEGRRPDLLGARVYRVIDNTGTVIPNEYIVLQDFIQNGCGAGSANCDWNDNVFYFKNIRPQAIPTATPINDQNVTVAQNFELNITEAFDKGYAGNQLTYSLNLINNLPLPNWLTFNEVSGVLSGIVPASALGSTQTISIEATDFNGLKASTEFTLTVSGATTAIRTLPTATTTTTSTIVVFPNPTSDLVNIQSQQNNIQKIDLFDTNSAGLITSFSKSDIETPNGLQFSTTTYSQGVYVLKVTFDTGESEELLIEITR